MLIAQYSLVRKGHRQTDSISHIPEMGLNLVQVAIPEDWLQSLQPSMEQAEMFPQARMPYCISAPQLGYQAMDVENLGFNINCRPHDVTAQATSRQQPHTHASNPNMPCFNKVCTQRILGQLTLNPHVALIRMERVPVGHTGQDCLWCHTDVILHEKKNQSTNK